MPHPPLQQLHDDFMAECRYATRLSPATLRNYQATFDLFVKVIPEAAVEHLSPETLTRFFRRLEDRERISPRGRIKHGIKSTTIASYRAKLSPFFVWLKARRHIAASPFDSMPYPKVVYDEPKYIRKEQIEKIITAADFAVPWSSSFIQKRNVAILIVLLYTGLRKSELLNLQLHDLDMRRGELKVTAITSKSKQHKTLPLNATVQRKLADYLAELKKKRYTNPCLFTADNRDEPLSEQGLKHLIKKVSQASGVRFHAHQLRHTFAVNLINSGSDVSVVQKLMGHKSLVSTLTYLRCIPSSTMRKSVEAMSWENLV